MSLIGDNRSGAWRLHRHQGPCVHGVQVHMGGGGAMHCLGNGHMHSSLSPPIRTPSRKTVVTAPPPPSLCPTVVPFMRALWKGWFEGWRLAYRMR